MTPRERAMCAFRHEVPDTAPAYVRNVLDWERHARYFGASSIDELFSVLGNTIKTFEPVPASPSQNAPQLHLNMWGVDNEYGGTYTDSVRRPLAHAQTPEDVHAFNWPLGENWDFVPMRDLLVEEETFVRLSPSWNPVFSRLCELFGMENTLINLATNLPVIEAALEHLDLYYSRYYTDMIETCAEHLDVFGLGDDFAANEGLLFSPDLWRKLFKPLYAKWLDMAKSKGLITFMHCCGNLTQVLPDLIDIGLDAWQTVQTHLPGQSAAYLKREYGRHLAFVGAIDTTNVLGKGSPEEVAEHVRAQILALGKGGGFICAPDHTIMAEVASENVAALYRTCADFRMDGYTRDL